ncbi:AAA family ATPase [Bailinhaonella thermotolerans]|uniref:ATP-binding protein n=1 Tax=Bailinhaonella thermotolerans TaxID=1070861 RepID=A0A3A4B6I5_9ACTN|nr:AAA family ATPase [Bailinhaonella thermotolerans]RJL27172.1 ATP-binding protein [Bailinhaonella thermotolerans]
METASVIIVSGPPGAGKSTVARRLAEDLSPSVHLHTDDFYTCIRRGFVPPHLPESRRQNEVVIGVMTACAYGYAAGGYHVALDGIVGPWFLPPFQQAAAEHGISTYYVVLRPERDTALARATARTGDALTDPGPVLHMYDELADLGPLEPHVLDSTTQTPAETAAAILTALPTYRLPTP